MRIVIVHPVVQDALPTKTCFFCGYPVHLLGIRCLDEAAGSIVLGLVCTTCLQHEPAQLQATLSEKARLLSQQESTVRSQAEQLLAQAQALEQWAREPLEMPPADDLERMSHLLG